MAEPVLPAPVHPLDRPFAAAAAAAAPDAAGITLACRHPSAILQVLAFPGQDAAVGERLATVGGAHGGVVLRGTGPGDWLAIAGFETPESLEHAIESAVGSMAATVEQSASRVVLRLAGPEVRALLSKGTAVDLHPDAFSANQTAATLFNHFAILLTRCDDDAFEIVVARSVSEHFLAFLLAAGEEYGIRLVAEAR